MKEIPRSCIIEFGIGNIRFLIFLVLLRQNQKSKFLCIFMAEEVEKPIFEEVRKVNAILGKRVFIIGKTEIRPMLAMLFLVFFSGAIAMFLWNAEWIMDSSSSDQNSSVLPE